MARAFIFPGQASQFVGMGLKLYNSDPSAREMIEMADDILGYNLSEIMFEGPGDLLKQTIHTQPAVYLHSMLCFHKNFNGEIPAAAAGHSLGEITAVVASGAMNFQDGLKLVQARAECMQMACEANPSTMAAILGLEDEIVEEICASIDDVVVPANYNCPGQLVISGSKEGIDRAIEACKRAGARRALEIPVGGAFHSPLMNPGRDMFVELIKELEIRDAQYPIYQNVDALPRKQGDEIKNNLVTQIVSPVRWTETIQNMILAGIGEFLEIGGRGRILAGMVKKISKEAEVFIWNEEE